MKVVMLRTHGINPDPRCEKELNSMLLVPGLAVSAVAWDRNSNIKKQCASLHLSNGTVPIIRFGVPASWGGGMKVNFLPMLKFEWKLFWWLIKNTKEYDCVHACDLLTGLPALLPCKIFHKKIVYDIFDYYAATTHGPQRLLNLFAKLEDFVINHSDVTIICSEKRMEQISQASPKKLVVLHNAPSREQLEVPIDGVTVKSKGLSVDRVKIIYVGNLVEDRFILKALSLADSIPNVEFHIGGMGALEDVVARIAQEKENVFFYGKMKYSDVISLENQGDILLALYDPALPNHRYAAPNKFYEALALGKPLIMFHNTGMDDIVMANNIGAVCDATEKGIYSAIIELQSKRDVWAPMAEKMKALFDEEYSWNIMEKRLMSLYEEIVGS